MLGEDGFHFVLALLAIQLVVGSRRLESSLTLHPSGTGEVFQLVGHGRQIAERVDCGLLQVVADGSTGEAQTTHLALFGQEGILAPLLAADGQRFERLLDLGFLGRHFHFLFSSSSVSAAFSHTLRSIKAGGMGACKIANSANSGVW